MSTVRELVTKWGFDIDEAPLKKLDNSISGMKKTLKQMAFLGAGAATGIGLILKEAGDMEQVEVAFETMLGSAERAKVLLEDLKEFAVKTPFNFKGITESSKKLLAFGFAAKEIIPTMQSLGNIAAGVGTDKLPQLILALGQVRAATKLRGQELRQFTEAGVPLIEELAKLKGVAEKEVQDLVSAGKVSFDDVNKALKQLTGEGGRFNNLMIKQSKTLGGLISNVIDFLQIMASDIGKELLPAAKELIGEFLDFVEVNRKLIKSKAAQFFKQLVVLLKNLKEILHGVYTVLNLGAQALGGWESALRKVIAAVSVFLALKLLFYLGSMAQAITGLLIPAFTTMGRAALLANIKMALIPIAIGALIVAIGLLVEDIVAFFHGKDSVFGRAMAFVFQQFNEWSRWFDNLGFFGKNLVNAILMPLRAIAGAIKNIVILWNMLRGKTGFTEGLKSLGKNMVNTFMGANSPFSDGSLSSSMGFNPQELINKAAEMRQDVSGVSRNAPLGGQNIQQFVEPTINLTVPPNLPPEQAQQAVQDGISDAFSGILRDSQREAFNLVER